MNVGHEEEELKPYVEPKPDYNDPRRTGQGSMDVWESLLTSVRMKLLMLTSLVEFLVYQFDVFTDLTQ